MRLRTLIVLLGLLGLGLSPSVEASPSSQTPSYRILLRSREFTPAPGIEPGARARILAEGTARHVIVQLNDIPSAAQQQALAARGIRLLHYLPEHAWFASLSGGVLPQAGVSAEVRWLGEIQTADKLPARLVQGKPLAHAIVDGGLRLGVYYFDDVSESAAINLIAKHGGALEQQTWDFRALTVRLPLGALTALAAEDAVRWIEEAPPPPTAMNDSIRSRMRANEVQAAPYNLTGSGVIVGMWDCGPIALHPDLAGRISFAAGQTDNCSSPPQHSTHVAGTLAGSGANSQVNGGAPFQWRGLAPAAYIAAYDYFNAPPEVQSAIATYNIDLANNSWGFVPSGGEDCHSVLGNYNNQAPEYDQIVTGLYGKLVAVLFAAGNTQQPLGGCGGFNTVTPPSTAKNVISVGATNSLDDTMTSFSAWGPTDDGRTKPDLVAPGYRNDFPSLPGCSPSYFTGIVSTNTSNGYCMLFGTSMSTPAVSGMLALVLQQFRNTAGLPSAALLPSSLKAFAVHGAVDLGNAGPDYKFGWGRADAKNSVDLARRLSLRESVYVNQTIVYNVNVRSCDSALKVTLAWDDPAGVQNASPALVNNLDLSLRAPDDTPYFPWLLDPANPNNAALRGPDNRNNVEQVFVSNPVTGTWQIRVSAPSNNIPRGPQRFSLVSEALNSPLLYTVQPSIVQPGAQIVLRGGPFDAGCAPGNVTVDFGGGTSVSVPPSSYTTDSLTVTVPSNAQSGNVTVTTSAGTSNAIFLGVVRPALYLPLGVKNYPPAFNWIDAASGGTRVANGDDVFDAVALPFPFTFFGNTYTSLYVSSNGFVSFGTGYSQPNSTCIPSAAGPNNAIYAFWTDLNPSASAGGAVWSKVVGSTLVIEWQDVPRFGTNDRQTFEIILGADNSITMQYLSVTNANDTVVGVENASGSFALQNYCNRSNVNVDVGSRPFAGQVVYYLAP